MRGKLSSGYQVTFKVAASAVPDVRQLTPPNTAGGSLLKETLGRRQTILFLSLVMRSVKIHLKSIRKTKETIAVEAFMIQSKEKIIWEL